MNKHIVKQIAKQIADVAWECYSQPNPKMLSVMRSDAYDRFWLTDGEHWHCIVDPNNITRVSMIPKNLKFVCNLPNYKDRRKWVDLFLSKVGHGRY